MSGHVDRIYYRMCIAYGEKQLQVEANRKIIEEKPWLSHLFVVRSFMNEMIILMKVVGFLVGTVLYLKGGLLTMEYYFKLTNIIAVS
jgi:hypothetical protein